MTDPAPGAFDRIVATRWRIARLLPRAGAGLVTLAAAVNLALGVLPVAFIVATSVMLGRVPAAVQAGLGSPAWQQVTSAFIVASVLFAAQQVLAPLQSALGELISRRLDKLVFHRLMTASLRSRGIGPLEDQALLDQLGEASHELEFGFQSPGRAGAGLLALASRITQLVGCVVVIWAAYAWWAALGTAAVVLMFRHGQSGGLRRYAQCFTTIAAQRRKARYLRQLAMRAPAGKEIRVFGLAGWLRDGYRAAYLSWVLPIWGHRRRIMFRPFFWYGGAGVLGSAAVLAAVAHAGAAALDPVVAGGAQGPAGFTLAELALTLQAILAALRLGEHYPECDTQTQFGMTALDAVRRYETGVAAAEPDLDAVGAPAPAPEREIRFSQVTFHYPGRVEPVFGGLDLTIPAGACTAVVGANGAGKTTLVKLLTRLYEPDRGVITVDGRDIRSLPVAAWRARVGVIFQDFNRYEVSAADNIGFGAVEHLDDRDAIREAARAAGILAVLDGLPRGLDTVLARHATDGAELSGGQWQRVALARALFAVAKGASVLVLDEPTANLDVRAEARFFTEFVALTRGVTTLLISHRFSTVRHADHIVVLADGQVREQGSHDALMSLGGRYETLFRLQADRFADPVPGLGEPVEARP